MYLRVCTHIWHEIDTRILLGLSGLITSSRVMPVLYFTVHSSSEAFDLNASYIFHTFIQFHLIGTWLYMCTVSISRAHGHCVRTFRSHKNMSTILQQLPQLDTRIDSMCQNHCIGVCNTMLTHFLFAINCVTNANIHIIPIVAKIWFIYVLF